MEKRDKEEMSRRKLLKIVGVSAAASAAALYGCASEGKPASSEASVLGEVPVDKMTYRVSPKGGACLTFRIWMYALAVETCTGQRWKCDRSGCGE